MSKGINKKEKSRKRKRIEHWEVIAIYLILYDIFAINFSYFFGLLLRFDLRFTNIPQEYLHAFFQFSPIYTVFSIGIFYFLRLYKSIWRFASYSELNRVCVATVITTIFHVVGITAFMQRMPISYYMIGAVMQTAMMLAVRFSYRFVTLERGKRDDGTSIKHNAMIIGAGSAGLIIVRELKNAKEVAVKPCCFIDDNSNKWGRYMDGVLVAGGRDSIMACVEKYHIDQILIAIPSAKPKERTDILNICKETGCELKILPGVYQLATGEVSVARMKAVAVEDLLGRDPIKVNMDEIFQQLKGKTILVTGGGGSIGSELCRQIAGHEPRQLIIFDVYENNAYEIEQELKRKYKDLNLVTLIGSVRDSRRINWVFEHYRPDYVYHAAAHKHVPLMEASPNEAIKNNVIGTYKTAYAAMKYGAERFVLISTDKAVNPTNIMGASKRLCEMVIQSMDAISKAGRFDLLPFLHAHAEPGVAYANQAAACAEQEAACAEQEAACAEQEAACAEQEAAGGQVLHDELESIYADRLTEKEARITIESVKTKDRKGTQFVAVRFGNVLGSNGSVVPLFKKQIEAGGPVTVTHPDIVRYFMTIPEAVSLVLQAGCYAWGGEIFVLDMGESIKIDTLARNLIKLSGYEPDVDIKVKYTGLRPGEKLFEEKLMAEEGIKKTENDLIYIGKPIPFDIHVFLKQLEELARASYENREDIVDMVKMIVHTFHPADIKQKGE